MFRGDEERGVLASDSKGTACCVALFVLVSVSLCHFIQRREQCRLECRYIYRFMFGQTRAAIAVGSC